MLLIFINLNVDQHNIKVGILVTGASCVLVDHLQGGYKLVTAAHNHEQGSRY